MADILVAKRLIDYVGLGVKGIPEAYQRLGKDVALVLALNEVMGPDGAQLMRGDNANSLQTSIWGPSDTLQSLPYKQLQIRRADVDSYGYNNNDKVIVQAGIDLFNDVTAGSHRLRSANAQIMGSTQGLGVALVSPPGNWTVQTNSGLGNQSSGTRAAGGAGVRHVCTGLSFVISCQAAPAAGNIVINLRDGGSGLGTVLESWQIGIPAQVFNPITVTRSGLSIIGSAATAMTLESSAAYAAVYVAVDFEGFDAS